MANPIFKIKQKETSGDWSDDYPIGSIFENVYYDENTNFTLKDLHNYVVGTSYLYVGEKEPEDTTVKVWYQTATE